ncbi:hypothetical protein Lal_00027204 [Lupinus albus]|nr:hypothetical protein Lal_00027204 [Lupinus albus]
MRAFQEQGALGLILELEKRVDMNDEKYENLGHYTDRHPAPTDEPEPTAAPNQPESHTQSSAYAAMPTNKMIMDELVSLRGYITTRMDAFDTQNQQIHYELHRLSSRLSNVDVDEESSEPES